MNKYVAFMRAINVAGHASVRMSDLTDPFATAGCTGVKTYIQSGNVIFESSEKNTTELFQKVRVRLHDLLGHEPGVLFRTVLEVEDIRSRTFLSTR